MKNTGTISVIVALSLIEIAMLTSMIVNKPKQKNAVYFVEVSKEEDSTLCEEVKDTVDLFDKAIDHLKHHEGFRSNWYTGAGGSKLIGYGHKHLKGETYSGLTPILASSLLESDFKKHLVLVENKYPQFNDSQHIALALFSFNLGNYALHKAVKNGITSDTNKWLKYCHYRSGGKMVKSKRLSERREFEVNMFNKKKKW